MKNWLAYDIIWDTDDEVLADPLPSEVLFIQEIPDNDIENIADHLTDNFGWCVFECKYREYTEPTENWSGAYV